MGNEKWMPAGLMDRDIKEWLGEDSLCKQLMVGLAEREITSLTQREAILAQHHETPARNSAEIRNQVLASPLGVQLVRLGETHQRRFDRAFQAFLKGRAQSARAAWCRVLPIRIFTANRWISADRSPNRCSRRGGGRAAAPAAEAGGRCGRAGFGERHRPADRRLGPPAGGGAGDCGGSGRGRAARQAADAAFTALAWPPVATGEACAAYLCG